MNTNHTDEKSQVGNTEKENQKLMQTPKTVFRMASKSQLHMYTRRYLETSLQNFQRILLHPRILYIAKLVKSQKWFCYSTNEGVNEKKKWCGI